MARHFIGIRTEEFSKLFPRESHFKSARASSIFVIVVVQIYSYYITVNNSPIQDYVHPDNHTQPSYEMTPVFKPFTIIIVLSFALQNMPALEANQYCIFLRHQCLHFVFSKL